MSINQKYYRTTSPPHRPSTDTSQSSTIQDLPREEDGNNAMNLQEEQQPQQPQNQQPQNQQPQHQQPQHQQEPQDNISFQSQDTLGMVWFTINICLFICTQKLIYMHQLH